MGCSCGGVTCWLPSFCWSLFPPLLLPGSTEAAGPGVEIGSAGGAKVERGPESVLLVAGSGEESVLPGPERGLHRLESAGARFLFLRIEPWWRGT